MNPYALLSGDALAAHLGGYLIERWSYTSLATFARNEKEFERRYIYRERARSGASTVAGTAYHAALERYFDTLRDSGVEMSLAGMQETAYGVIDLTDANEWKPGKKTATVAQCIEEATRTVNQLLGNFYGERDIYAIDRSRILAVEEELEAWVTVSGVPIPLPMRGKLDLVAETPDGRRVIVDHKSRRSYTEDEELPYTGAKQSIGYVQLWEALHPDLPIDEVWYIENKHSRNKDGTPQLRRTEIRLDSDTRRLYEEILYEPLRRMIDAVSDPDYVYTINDSDPLTDMAELYDFWARTLTAELSEWPDIPEEKRELMAGRRRKIRDSSAASISPAVIKKFRREAAAFISYDLRDDMTKEEKIEHTLRTYNIRVRVAHTMGSYSSVSYLLEVGAGTPIRNIAAHALDIANALDVARVRILPELTVYSGKSYLCVESPHRSGDTLIWDAGYLDGLRLPLGLDNFGRVIRWDLRNPSTPHMLICGATGSGKSVCIRSTIEYAQAAGVARIIVMDPKYEFGSLAGCEVIQDIDIIEERMKELVAEMQARAKSGASVMTLIVFDEFADAVASARSGRALYIRDENGRTVGCERSLEENMKMLLQKGRSLGYRIMAATQRASTKVITGDAKVNFPVAVCFRVPKALDSKVVIDEEGAESLAGRGDGLIKSPEYFGAVRFQGFYKPS